MLQITFSLPHVFHPRSSQTEDDRVLRILLETLISLNLEFLAHHSVPALYQSGVVYGRTRVWEPIPALYQRRYGDCKSLSAALIAEYRRAGKEAYPVFRWERSHRNPGDTNYHILVQTAEGFEDPSKVLGMGRNEY